MTKLTCILIFSLCAITLSAQDSIGFETLLPGLDTFDNGSNSAGGFTQADLFLPNSYDKTFDVWSGWALSSMQDSLTGGFANQYSCIAGGGALDSEVYAVAYAFDPVVIQALDGRQLDLNGLYLNNSTYAYTSMRDGDAFSKRFGGITGQDPDFLKLTMHPYRAGDKGSDSIVFYLADFRFEQQDSDYLIRDWTYVDLSSLGPVDSLVFSLSSSDVGAFGMNTPAFFCLDHIISKQSTNAGEYGQTTLIKLYPNPAKDQLFMQRKGHSKGQWQIVDASGLVLRSGSHFQLEEIIPISFLAAGTYWLRVESEGRIQTIPWIKIP